MKPEYPSVVSNAFSTIPLLRKYTADDFHINRLEGYTNRNYRLRNKHLDWVLRIPEPKTNFTIDRLAEKHNARLAIKLGLAPQNLWQDDSGLSLTCTLKDAYPVTPESLIEPALLELLISKIRLLHNSGKPFHGEVNLQVLLTRYFDMLSQDVQQRERFDQIELAFRCAIEKVKLFDSLEQQLVPSHNDLVLENILVDLSAKLWIIDWEYASMASPYWDLATLSNAGKFSQQKCSQMLEYYANGADSLDLERLNDYRFVLRVLSICWLAAFTTVDINDDLHELKVSNTRSTG